MIKRITAMIIAVIIPVAMLGGCKGKQLTVQEYYDELLRCFKVYSETTQSLCIKDLGGEKLMSNFRFGNADDIAKLKEIISKREKAYDDLEKINPPEEYADKHKELVKSLKIERDWDKAVMKYKDAKDSTDADKINEEIEKILDVDPKTLYPWLHVMMMTELDKERGVISH